MCFSTEFVRFCGTFFFEWDIELTVDGQPATCNTSDLNEELGQVCFFSVFSILWSTSLDLSCIFSKFSKT